MAEGGTCGDHRAVRGAVLGGWGLSGGGHGTEACRAKLGSRGAGRALFSTQERQGPDFLGGVFSVVGDGKRFPALQGVRRLLPGLQDRRGGAAWSAR